MMSLQIAELRPDDYEQVAELWQEAGSASLSQDDLMALACGQCPFNSVLSLVVRDKGVLVAAILCRRDGQEGYLHHLAVLERYRKGQIIKMLVDKALLKLNAMRIYKCRIHVDQQYQDEPFWEAVSWFDTPEDDQQDDDENQVEASKDKSPPPANGDITPPHSQSKTNTQPVADSVGA